MLFMEFQKSRFMTPWRNFFSWFTKSVLPKYLGSKVLNQLVPFRAIKTDLRKAFENFDSPNILIDALLTWGTDNFRYG